MTVKKIKTGQQHQRMTMRAGDVQDGSLRAQKILKELNKAAFEQAFMTATCFLRGSWQSLEARAVSLRNLAPNRDLNGKIENFKAAREVLYQRSIFLPLILVTSFQISIERACKLHHHHNFI